MSEFWFIRHGQSEINYVKNGPKLKGGVNTWAELTFVGKKQAQSLNLNSNDFEAIYSSPAVRCQQTFRYCFDNPKLKLNIDDRLSEMYQGDWEGKYCYELKDQKHNSKDWDFVPGDIIKGESLNQVSDRMMKWLEEKKKQHTGRILVFTHSRSIMCLLTKYYDKEIGIIENCEIHKIKL